MLRNPNTNAGRPRGDQLEIYLFVKAWTLFLGISVNKFCNEHYKSFDDISLRREYYRGPFRGRISSGETLRRRFNEVRNMLQDYYAGLEKPGIRVNLPSPNGKDRMEALVAEHVAFLEADRRRQEKNT